MIYLDDLLKIKNKNDFLSFRVSRLSDPSGKSRYGSKVFSICWWINGVAKTALINNVSKSRSVIRSSKKFKYDLLKTEFTFLYSHVCSELNVSKSDVEYAVRLLISKGLFKRIYLKKLNKYIMQATDLFFRCFKDIKQMISSLFSELRIINTPKRPVLLDHNSIDYHNESSSIDDSDDYIDLFPDS